VCIAKKAYSTYSLSTMLLKRQESTSLRDLGRISTLRYRVVDSLDGFKESMVLCVPELQITSMLPTSMYFTSGASNLY
jgi:hypothetical protein